MMDTFEVHPIGIVRSPYRKRTDAPPQGRFNQEAEMEIEISPEYVDGLGDFTGISHLIVLLWFDRARRDTLSGRPPWATEERPVFQTRSPNRPNPIGLDVGKIVEMREGTIRVSGLDALDGTPVLDIKPYIPSLDCIPGATERKRNLK
jgi:tRNA-Thr(GGU) m(6)t(6)A37 methyltransferase TsaA